MSTNDNESTSPLKTNWLPLTGSNNIEIDRIAELRQVSFLMQYGDYASCLFKKLRSAALVQDIQLPRTVAAFQRALHNESERGGPVGVGI